MNVPDQIKQHLEYIISSSDEEWAKEEGAFDRLCEVWEKKEGLFSDQIRLLGMEELKEIPSDDERGMLFLTFSGSLVSLGCGGERWMEYASIKLRTDVPDIIRCDKTSLAESASFGKAAKFSDGPLKHTSALYRIVVCSGDVPESEQEKRIREATVFLTNSFIHLNRDLTQQMEDENGDQFRKQNIIAYLARKSGLPQAKVREITDDYLSMLETGMLLGKTVSLGRIGRFSLGLKPRRKARLGRNPKSGEEMTIPAREAHWSPVFKFSAGCKEKAATLPVPEERDEE